LSDVKSFFEKHTHHHAYHRDPSSYLDIIDKIKKTLVTDQLNILDLGCGDGSFMRALARSGVKGNFVGIDLSYNMVSQALRESERGSTGLLVADGFNLPIQAEIRFDLIHIDSVLHHLISKSRRGSRKLAEKFIMLLHDRLSENGVILVEEMYYVSFVFPEFTSATIFYGLKLINILGIDFSKIRNEFQPGLEVNFFSEEGLQKLFDKFSKNVNRIKRTPLRVPRLYRVFLAKQLGHVSYAVYR
jgi:SAM-dependent methyltransferase